MAEIVITEFMDDQVARELMEDRNVLYEPDLVDRPDLKYPGFTPGVPDQIRSAADMFEAIAESTPVADADNVAD